MTPPSSATVTWTEISTRQWTVARAFGSVGASAPSEPAELPADSHVSSRRGDGWASRCAAVPTATSTDDHGDLVPLGATRSRSEEHTSELQSLMRNSYAVFCLKKK